MNFSSLVERLARAARIYKRNVSPISYLARRFIAKSGQVTNFQNVTPRCLDIGSGTAPYKTDLYISFNLDYYVSLDLMPATGTNLVADVCQLPISNAQIDLVTAFDVIQHIPDSDLMFDEITRVLLPNGCVLLTFPFLYPECDAHDFRRWTMEGIAYELNKRGFHVIHADQRGGRCFAIACALLWFIQHLVPGQRKRWRAKRTWLGVAHAALVLILTLPVQPLMWISLMLDYLLPPGGYYMGGAIFARKAILFR